MLNINLNNFNSYTCSCFAYHDNSNNYTVSQKTSHLWLAITLTHTNGFLYFFGRNVTDKVGNEKTLYRCHLK